MTSGFKFRAFLASLIIGSAFGGPTDLGTCEPIKVDMCKHIGYNYTAMPNLVGHNLQADANFELENFSLLIKSSCSKELQFFLCFAYTPMCVAQISTPQRLIGPCRPLCERVKKSCLFLLEKFNYPWPLGLNCSKFPTSNNDQHMCMEGPRESDKTLPIPHTSSQTNNLLHKKWKELGDLSELQKYVQLFGSDLDTQNTGKIFKVDCIQFKKPSMYQYVARLGTCVPLCQADIAFSKEDKASANKVIIALSSLGFLLMLFSSITLLVDDALSARTLHDLTRKTIFFLTLAQTGLCAAYLLSRFFSPEELCIKADEKSEILLSAMEGHRNQACTMISLFLYFFISAAGNWFTVFLVHWSLASSKWVANKSEPTLSVLSHVYGWAIPAIMSLAALVTHQVEADEYSGICMPGGFLNDFSFLLFIVVPQGIQLFLSVLFVPAGIALSLALSSLKSPSPTSHGRKKPTDLNPRNHSVVYTIFAVLYLLSFGCVFGIHSYEYNQRKLWYDIKGQNGAPDSNMFVFRLVMTFVMALAPSILVLNKKSYSAWHRRFCGSVLVQAWRHDKQKTPDYPTVAYQSQVCMENPLDYGHNYLHRPN